MGGRRWSWEGVEKTPVIVQTQTSSFFLFSENEDTKKKRKSLGTKVSRDVSILLSD